MSERPLFVLPTEGADVDTGPPAGPGPDEWDERRMTVIEHLADLRKVLIHSLVAWGLASLVGLVLSFWIVKALTLPLSIAGYKPYVTTPMGNVTVYLTVGMLAGLVLALPVIGQRVWWFVAPGLKPKERRFARPMLLSSIVLFSVGALLAYAFTFMGIQMLAHFTQFTGITYLPVLDDYLGTMAFLIVAFGITFEFPVALVLLALVGLVSSTRLRQGRKYAILVILAVGYAITPGADPITPLPLIIPLLLLYEGAILVIRRMGR